MGGVAIKFPELIGNKSEGSGSKLSNALCTWLADNVHTARILDNTTRSY